MSDDRDQEDRLAALERQLAERGRRTGSGRFADRELPDDLFGRTMRGEISLREAKDRAQDRWESDEARGGSMDDLIRRRYSELSDPSELHKEARDARGRFAARDGRLDMNSRMREAVFGAAAYATPAPAPGPQRSANELIQEKISGRRSDRSADYPHLGDAA